MNRAHRLLIASVAVACLWPAAGAAQAQELPASTPLMTVDQARSAFATAGYRVDQTYNWDWTSPPVSSFQVRDPGNERVVMVLVYPSATAAQAGRLGAQAHEHALAAGQPVRSASGPHLVVGYGQSLWDGNVALVQTTESQLERLDRAQADLANGVYRDPIVARDPGVPDFVVDLDFLQALQNGAVNL